METTSYTIHVPKPLWQMLKAKVALSEYTTLNEAIVALVEGYVKINALDGVSFSEVSAAYATLTQPEVIEADKND